MVEASQDILEEPRSALDLLIDEENNIQILSSSNDFNKLLGGGILLGKISELCGPPGIGKTQICLQLCANTILNYTKKVKDFDNFYDTSSCNLEAVFIDTEGSFVPQRLKEILMLSPNFELNFFENHNSTKISNDPLQNKTSDKTIIPKIENFESNLDGILLNKSPTFGRKCISPIKEIKFDHFNGCKQHKEEYAEKLLNRHFHYFRCNNHLELIALSIQLPDYLEKHPLISLVVIDSMAFFFRIQDNKNQRNRILATLSRNFLNLINRPESGKGFVCTTKVAILLTNQVSFNQKSCNQTSNLTTLNNYNISCDMTPCMGDLWGHVSHLKLLLYWYAHKRCAKLLKAPHSPQQIELTFDIDARGIVDIP